LFTVLQLTLEVMSAPWPAPVLRERQDDLGWLALSPPEDDIRIGVTGATKQEAEASYAERRAVWQALREAREAEVAAGQPVTAERDRPAREERVSPAGPDPGAVLRVAAAGVKNT